MSVIWSLGAALITFDAKDDGMAEALLRELCDNGKARLVDGAWCVSYEEVAKLEECDRAMLDLPERYPYTLRVDAIGDLHEADFRFRYSFCRHFHGETLACERSGPFVFHTGGRGSEEQWLLSYEQMAICDEIDCLGEHGGARDLGTALLALKKIQGWAGDNAAELSPLLADTEVATPEIIDIDLHAEGDALCVTPVLKDLGVSPEKFADRVERWRRPRNVYSENTSDGRVKRVVFSPEKTEALSQIKRQKTLRGEAKRAFLENPQEFLDPNHVNLDDFGARVVEIGFYTPNTCRL